MLLRIRRSWQGDPHTTPPPGIGDGGVDSAAVNSAKGGGTKEWEGLGAWEGLGEGLSGVSFSCTVFYYRSFV